MLLEIDETDLICLFDLMDVDRSGDLTYEDRLDRRKRNIFWDHMDGRSPWWPRRRFFCCWGGVVVIFDEKNHGGSWHPDYQTIIHTFNISVFSDKRILTIFIQNFPSSPNQKNTKKMSNSWEVGSLQISQPSYQNLDQGFVGEPPLHMGNGWVSPPQKTLQPLFPAGEELVNCIHKSETNDLKRQMMLVKLQATMGVLDWGLEIPWISWFFAWHLRMKIYIAIFKNLEVHEMKKRWPNNRDQKLPVKSMFGYHWGAGHLASSPWSFERCAGNDHQLSEGGGPYGTRLMAKLFSVLVWSVPLASPQHKWLLLPVPGPVQLAASDYRRHASLLCWMPRLTLLGSLHQTGTLQGRGFPPCQCWNTTHHGSDVPTVVSCQYFLEAEVQCVQLQAACEQSAGRSLWKAVMYPIMCSLSMHRIFSPMSWSLSRLCIDQSLYIDMQLLDCQVRSTWCTLKHHVN